MTGITQVPGKARWIIHIDMDAFFAAVEILDHPELAGLPVVVGGRAEERGVVAAASYEARRYGIRSAMPMATARLRCPQLVVLPPRHRLYSQVSQRIMAIFGRYTPLVEQVSVDEAFLDVTASLGLFGSAAAIGREIQSAIELEENLSASVGIGPNKFIAKLASEFRKPHGFTVVLAEEAADFLDPLPVAALWGVGRRTADKLQGMGISRVSQLKALSQAQLTASFGKYGGQLYLLCRGIDDSPVQTGYEAKSLGRETTFARDMGDPRYLIARLSILTDQVGLRLRRSGQCCRTVTLKLRYNDWETISRAQTLPEAADLTQTIYAAALKLLQGEFPLKKDVRLIGVTVSHLQPAATGQQSLFTADPRQEKISRAMDRLKEKFGEDILRPGISLYARDGEDTSVKREKPIKPPEDQNKY